MNLLYDINKTLDRSLFPRPGFLEKNFPGKRIMPKLFLIGAQKSGTSSLYNALIQHRNIIPSKTKEMFYFGNDINFAKGLNYYKAFFATSLFEKNYNRRNKVNAFCCDASTDSFENPFAPERIKKCVPDAKIILMLRNPVQRAFSHYKMSVKLGFEKADFSTALKFEQQRILNDVDLLTHGDHLLFKRLAYCKRGEYYRYIEPWFLHFKRDHILVLKSEDYFLNPSDVFKNVEQFLKINNSKNINFKPVNVSTLDNKISKQDQDQLNNHYKEWNKKLFQFLNVNWSWES